MNNSGSHATPLISLPPANSIQVSWWESNGKNVYCIGFYGDPEMEIMFRLFGLLERLDFKPYWSHKGIVTGDIDVDNYVTLIQPDKLNHLQVIELIKPIVQLLIKQNDTGGVIAPSQG